MKSLVKLLKSVRNRLRVTPKEWAVKNYQVGANRCALGHLELTLRLSEEERRAVKLAFSKVVGASMANTNDYQEEPFTQETPKKRVLAAFDKVIKNHERN